MSTNGPDRISISRDALRADLAELELRIREFVTGALALKADSATVIQLIKDFGELRSRVVLKDGPLMEEFQAHTQSLRKLGEGEFSAPQKRAIKEIMEGELQEHTDIGWTNRQRVMAVSTLFITVVVSAIGIFATFYYGG